MLRLAKPDIPQEVLDKVASTIRSGNLVQGREVASFEEALAAYLGIEHAVLCSSGTAALHLAVLAAGIGCEDEVLCPAFTFPASANVIAQVGGKIVLVDIGLDDFCLDPARLEEALSPATRAIMTVHEFGQAADMSRILPFARTHGLIVIEDACCALGTEHGGRKVGTFGDMGCFSFHPRKAITTGEGGLVVTANGERAAMLRALRNHGIVYGDGRMDFLYAGLNYRMTEFQAVLGASQLGGLNEAISQRIAQARCYDEALASCKLVSTPTVFGDRKACYQTYHLLLSEAVNRTALMSRMREAGVETNYGAQALQCMTYFRRAYGLKPEDYPRALAAYSRGLALPIGPHLSEGDIHHVAESLLQNLTHYED